jgi:Trk K+ transport system NAD-binding subunit
LFQAGQTLRELRFRQKYGASVLAVHRPDENANKKKKSSGSLQPVGTFEIRRGDSLLLLADPEFKVCKLVCLFIFCLFLFLVRNSQ